MNEYRPHQAREALILLMEEQVERGKAERKGMEELKAKVDEVLAGFEDGLDWGPAGVSRSGHQSEEEKKLDAEKRMWEFLREDIGP